MENMELASRSLDVMLADYPQNKGLLYLRALFNEQIGKREDAREDIKKLSQVITSDPDFKNHLQTVERTSHEVFEYSHDKVGQMAIVYKFGGKKGLEEEVELIELFNPHIQEEKTIKTAIPIEIIPFLDQYLMSMKREKGVPLSRLQNEKKLDYIFRYAKILGIIHGVMPANQPPQEFIPSLQTQVKKISELSEEHQEVMMKCYIDIFESFKHLPRVYNKDAHGDNLFITEHPSKDPARSTLTVLDFENRGTAFAGFDTSKMIHQSGMVIGYKDWNIEHEIVRYYLESFEAYRTLDKKKVESHEEFMLNHLKSTVIKAMSYYGFSHNISSKHDISSMMLINAMGSIVKIKDHFPEEFSFHKEEYTILFNLMLDITKTRNHDYLAPER